MMADAVPLAASAKMAAFPLEGAIVPGWLHGAEHDE